MHQYDLKKAFDLSERFERRLKRDLFCDISAMKCEFALASKQTPFAERLKLKYHPIANGEIWGRTWQTGWFHFTGKLGKMPEANTVPIVRINTGSEALLFSGKGKALSGLTSFCWFADDFVREEYYPPISIAGKAVEFWCAVTANKLAGMDVDYDPSYAAEENGTFNAQFKFAEIGWMRTEVKSLMLDIKCLRSLASTFSDNDYRKKDFAVVFNQAETLYADNPANATATRAILAPLLKRPAYASALTVTAVGHSHIDTAYMWPVREAVQKCARTYATQLALMDKYPEYVFGASAPLHYKLIKETYPEIYARIKKAVAAGRWEPQGGMWVEADINIPDGESLVRQFLHGKNFFKDEFGFEVRNVWLPDDFGYTGALPQIMKLARCETFVSIKLAVSDCNKYPYHTFHWRGIDGTEVLVHLPPEGFYSSWLQPATLCKAQNDYAESAETGEFLSLFGLGDGGSGATMEDIEAGRRLANLEGAPKLQFGAAQPLLDRLHKCWDKLPTWDGEMYLERHRGITSSMARFKRGNRKNEQRLAQTEFLCTMLLNGKDYPIAELDKAWKLLLLHQFHDIMSGTSLDETYLETQRDYDEINRICDAALQKAASKLKKDDNAAVIVNTLSSHIDGKITLPKEWCGFAAVDCNGKELPSCLNEDGTVTVELPIITESTTIFKGKKKAKAQKVEFVKKTVLENDYMRYEFDNNLQIVSAYDKEAGMELIPTGKAGNELRLYRDYPNDYEAWDIDKHYRESIPEHPQNVSSTVKKVGNTLFAEMRVGNSTIRQWATLEEHSHLLTFKTELDWHEKRKMLRVAFPTTLTSDYATYDVQFGALRRPTGENTSWDVAKFEMLQHKFMDLSDNGYGVAILNDCKYGGRVYAHDLELTLQRSPRFPSMHTEEGHQEFKYAFLPHSGTCAQAGVQQKAEIFNREPLVIMGRSIEKQHHHFKICEPWAVSLTACKRAEKSDDIIIRLVERNGKHETITVNALDNYRIAECDLLEWENVKTKETTLTLKFHPFEIKTLRLRKTTSLQH